ncbi:hypothetical protein JNK62_02235 [bacterium]|jgi:hypothetical protein|nr:hypothetical protein [bacterium]
MIDAIGLTDALLGLAVWCSSAFFVLSLLLFRFLLKKSVANSILMSIAVGLIGAISSPFLFYAYIKLIGYSLI